MTRPALDPSLLSLPPYPAPPPARTVLFVYGRRSSFVEIDLALLSQTYSIREWRSRRRIVNPLPLARAVAASDMVFGWFADWHTFYPVLLAKLLRRPSILVVGGYDTANLPEIGYGNQRGGLTRWVTRWTIRHADRLVINSNFARNEAIRNGGADAARVTVVYHGLPVPPPPENEKEKLVITVGDVSRDTLLRKGLMPFVRAAARVPDVPFVLMGEWRGRAIDSLREVAPPNVTFTGRVSAAELDDYMARAQVYVQASRHEGFGMALAEAMLHECVPVVTRAGALPEVVGDAGLYTESTEPEALAACIQQALDTKVDLGTQARERIVREFPLPRRREGLERVMKAAMNQ